MAKRFFWNELKSSEFALLSPDTTIAILPIASTEQHGPHLPIATDTAIANGMIEQVLKILPDELNVLFLPTQEIGKANEHIYGPGTLSFGAELLIQMWTAIGAKVSEAGLKKLVIVNSHGGNTDLMSIVAREIRVRFNMIAVGTHWGRFSLPDGMFSDHEMKYGIHGGDMETSVMLYLRPDLVDMAKAQNFVSHAEWMSANTKYLQPTQPHALAWIAHDLNPHGVVGNASAASVQKGKIVCECFAKGFVELLHDVARYPVTALYKP